MLVVPAGVSAIGVDIPVSTMRTAPTAKFGKATKIGEKPNPSPGPGAYPIMTALGVCVSAPWSFALSADCACHSGPSCMPGMGLTLCVQRMQTP